LPFPTLSPKALQGERIEPLAYVKEKGLKVE
jgi:hypothetical protein